MAYPENMAGDSSSTEEEDLTTEIKASCTPIPPKFQKNSPGLEHLATKEVSSPDEAALKIPLARTEVEARAHQAVPGELTAENIAKALTEPHQPNIPEGAVVNMMGAFGGFGAYRPDMSPVEVKTTTDYLIATEETNLPNLISLPNATLESAFNIHQRRFFDLMAIKASQSLDRDREDIEKIYKEFTTRWWLRAAELAANFGNKDRFMEIVPTVVFKEAFEYAWEIPGVAEGAGWIEGTEGRCFRDPITNSRGESAKPTDAIIISRISTELQGNGLTGPGANLAAALVYRLYVATGEITRFVGPLTDGGELVEKEAREQAFGRPNRVDLNDSRESYRYWNVWLNQWADPKYNFSNLETGFKSQLSGNCPFLWQRTIFTPEYLATHQEKSTFQARGLIRIFDTHVRPMSAFYGYENLVKLHQNSRTDPKISANFFLWASMVHLASDFVDNRVVPFLKAPFGSASGIFDEPQAKMAEVMKPFNELSTAFTYLNRLGPKEPSYARSYVLDEVLRYANTNEGQRVLRLRNEALHSNQLLGADQFQWAIASSRAGIDNEQIQKLFREYRGPVAVNTLRRGWVWFVRNALPGGRVLLWFYDRFKQFI